MAPPKGTSPETAAYIDLFKSIGLTQAKASEAAKNAKSAALLQDLIERHALTGGRIDEKQASLVAALAVQGAKIGEDERGYVVNAITSGRLKSTDQVNGTSQCPFVGRFRIHRMLTPRPHMQPQSNFLRPTRCPLIRLSLITNVELVSPIICPLALLI